MLEAIKKYFDYELNGLRVIARFHPHPEETWLAKDFVKQSTLSRGMGVILFAQLNGETYEEVAKLYDEFKEEVEQI